MFNHIARDSYINGIYNEISCLEDDFKIYCKHSQSHINNVVKTVDHILSCLGYDKNLIEDAKIAAMLHDMAVLKAKIIMPNAVIKWQKDI